MFEYYTSTRMKGSTVVQGLKSLASKLHPQLPLSPKESQRLLTALTTSFRKQLDQAHPWRIEDEEGKLERSNESVSKSSKQQLHSSSAAFADRHLASILTNPLLAKDSVAGKPDLDYESARIELQKNPSRDPVSLLNEYHEKGAATIPIAVLCLESFNNEILALPKNKQHEVLMEARAGKRILLWLWNSNLYETDSFVHNVRFIDLLVSMIMQEGSEKYLWEWLQMDMPLGGETNRVYATPNSAKRHRYRWKSRILKAMVAVELRRCKYKSANGALDIFLKACAIKSAAATPDNPDPYEYPLSSSARLLSVALLTRLECSANTDAKRFDRFIESVDLWTDSRLRRDLYTAELWLAHPRSPSPLPALKLLKEIREPPPQKIREPSSHDDLISILFMRPYQDRDRLRSYAFLKRLSTFLQGPGQAEDAKWVISLAQRLFPEIPLL